MIRYENDCVGCPPEMGCMGASCPYRHVEHHYCDERGSVAEYDFDTDELCEECLEKQLDKLWSELTNEEKAEALGYDLKKLGG